MPTQEPSHAKSPLAEPALRRLLEDFVRKRVSASDVDDVVQTVLCDALASEGRPSDREELRKWLLGIARHKIADHHRRVVREPATDLPDIEAHPPPLEARSLARWAEEQAASTHDAQKTLAWMAREGEGEKLENIAAEENVPAARVRQRVSRMRRWMKERWMAELAAVAALAVLAIIAWRVLRRPDEVPEARPDEVKPVPNLPPVQPDALERARALRADAFRLCDQEAWVGCVGMLDEAARLDPAGDTAPAVRDARDRAVKSLAPIPAPSATDSILAPPKSTTAPPAPTAKPPSFDEKKGPKPSPTATPKTSFSKEELDSVAPPPTSFSKSATPVPQQPTPKAAPKSESKPTKPRGDTTFDMKKKSGGKSSLGTLGSY